MSEFDIWGYPPDAGYQHGIDIVGYKVEATDGSIGKISKHSEDVGSSYLVVDTGVWIFGKHVLLPAGTIRLIDAAAETVYVDRTKEQIKDAPEFDEAKHAGEPSYLEQFGRYYRQPHM
ncbi:PRC-barrel domain-containing protein [Streptomyces sp. NBC_01310]|uniref:PRC-barrel domain-containing protein n=1 Tax=Streptomyces sp. NBC_01310 TaxID=2903820 RepID=UPI0035B5C012|nr:PRC-barrel domain-containing protein [Streptomyces sp. NBC_01310]WSJ63847.1 PRC-barrel domain-containing protein [Streptomyces sp. NBC_01310]